MSLKQQAASGAKWIGTSGAVVATIQLLQLAILARLLGPEDFGLMAMLLVVLGFAEAYSDMGISNAIIHRQDTTRDQLSSLYWLNLVAGAAVYLIVVATTPLIVILYDEPRLRDLVYLAALVLLLLPLGQQFRVLLEKALRFKQLAIIETSAALIGAAVAVGSALADQGVFALVWGQLSFAAWRSLSLLAIGSRDWRPRLHFRYKDLQGYVSFGLFQMGERSVNYVNSRLDQLLIGALLGAQALGYYTIAFYLVNLPLARINPILTRVAFPVFARVQDEIARLKLGYLTMQQVLAAVNFPTFFALAALAPVFVPLVLGGHWQPSVPLIQILAFVALLRSTGNPIGAILLAKGRADLGFYWNLSILFTQVVAIYAGARFGGGIGVAIALSLMQCIYFCLSYLVLVRRLLGPCLGDYLKSLLPGLVTSALTGAVLGLTVLLVETPSLPFLVLQVLGGILLYGGLNWLFYREESRALLRLVRQKSA